MVLRRVSANFHGQIMETIPFLFFFFNLLNLFKRTLIAAEAEIETVSLPQAVVN